MMPAETLLSRLGGVKQRGPGRWVAKCPAHDDRSPSPSIREVDDGKVLLHCFAGCGASDVVAAAGLELSDLFPEPLKQSGPIRDRKHTHAAVDALKVLALEATVLQVAADNLVRGVVLTETDMDRLALAAGRIRRARGVVAP